MEQSSARLRTHNLFLVTIKSDTLYTCKDLLFYLEFDIEGILAKELVGV